MHRRVHTEQERGRGELERAWILALSRQNFSTAHLVLLFLDLYCGSVALGIPTLVLHTQYCVAAPTAALPHYNTEKTLPPS
eukprot:3309867-Rhodomonas_salina.1